MNPTQRPFESCVRSAKLFARAERREEARQQLGVCFECRVPLAEHFDHLNAFLSCEDAVQRHLDRQIARIA